MIKYKKNNFDFSGRNISHERNLSLNELYMKDMLDSDWWRDRRKGGGGLSLMSGRRGLTKMIFTNYSVVK